MNNCAKDVNTVARLLDHQTILGKNSCSELEKINELRLIKILSDNKVSFQFAKKITSCNSSEILENFPRLRIYLNELWDKRQKDSVVFSQIKRKFSENNINFLLIKSDGFFPYESDNIDILIMPKMLGKVATMLKNEGYTEFPKVRERNKYLFRNLQAYDILPLHIHTRVEWEGTQFVDSTDLWARSKVTNDEGGFYAPSAEDCILITTAHLFFENHRIKLADLFKITSAISNNKIDWNYMLDHTKRLHWEDAFCLIMLLSNLACRELFGRNIMEKNILSKIEEEESNHVFFFQKILNAPSSNTTPIVIPYYFVVLFFIRRILYDNSLPFIERLKHVDWIASNVLRERIVRTQYPSVK